MQDKLLNEPIFHCVGCQERVRRRDLVETRIPPDRNEAAICFVCDEKTIHVRCMCECDQIFYALNGRWGCKECVLRSSESESDGDIAQDLLRYGIRLVRLERPNGRSHRRET